MTEDPLITALKKITDSGGKLFLVTNEGCPGCSEAKELFKTQIEDKLISVLDYQESDDAVTMTAALDLYEVPNLIAQFKDKICLIDEATGDVTKCKKIK